MTIRMLISEYGSKAMNGFASERVSYKAENLNGVAEKSDLYQHYNVCQIKNTPLTLQLFEIQIHEKYLENFTEAKTNSLGTAGVYHKREDSPAQQKTTCTHDGTKV